MSKTIEQRVKRLEQVVTLLACRGRGADTAKMMQGGPRKPEPAPGELEPENGDPEGE